MGIGLSHAGAHDHRAELGALLRPRRRDVRRDLLPHHGQRLRCRDLRVALRQLPQRPAARRRSPRAPGSPRPTWRRRAPCTRSPDSVIAPIVNAYSDVADPGVPLGGPGRPGRVRPRAAAAAGQARPTAWPPSANDLGGGFGAPESLSNDEVLGPPDREPALRPAPRPASSTCSSDDTDGPGRGADLGAGPGARPDRRRPQGRRRPDRARAGPARRRSSSRSSPTWSSDGYAEGTSTTSA